MKGGSFIEPSKRLQFGDVISGSTSSSRKPAKEGDKTYSKAVALPEGATTDKSSRIVYDSNGKRIGRRVAASTPKYVPDVRNAGSTSKQAADYINRSRGKTKAEMAGTTGGSSSAGQKDEVQAKKEAYNKLDREEEMRKSVSRGHVYPKNPTVKNPTAKKPTAKKPEPLKELESRKAAPIAQKPESTKKQGIQTRPSAPAAPKKPESSEGSGNKRIDRIKRRAEKKVSRIQDRRSKKENVKAAKAGARAMIREAKGKPAKMQQGDFKDTSTNVDFGKPSEMSPKDARKNARAQTKAVNKQYRKNVKAGLEKPVTPAIGNIRKKGGLMDRRKRK